jgi:hypothetical protein
MIEKKQSSVMSFVGFVGVVAIVASLVVVALFAATPISNNNNGLVLVGRYEDPRGASIEFIDENHAIMGTRIYGSGFEPVVNIWQGDVIIISGQGFESTENITLGNVVTISSNGFTSVENMPLTALIYVTYTLDGNQIAFYREISQGSEQGAIFVGYATISDNAQEIVFYGDIYTKN